MTFFSPLKTLLRIHNIEANKIYGWRKNYFVTYMLVFFVEKSQKLIKKYIYIVV